MEAGFLGGAIRLVAATTTLAAGVNLPARRVILKHHWVGRPSQWLTSTQLQQMAGRAGRAGLDTAGEVVLLCPRGADPTPFARLLHVSSFNFPVLCRKPLFVLKLQEIRHVGAADHTSIYCQPCMLPQRLLLQASIPSGNRKVLPFFGMSAGVITIFLRLASLERVLLASTSKI